MSYTFAGQPAVETEYTIDVGNDPGFVLADGLPSDGVISNLLQCIVSRAWISPSSYDWFHQGHFTLGEIACGMFDDILPGYSVHTRYHGLGVEPEPEAIIVLCKCDFSQVTNNHIALFYNVHLDLIEIRIVFNDTATVIWDLGHEYATVIDNNRQHKLYV